MAARSTDILDRPCGDPLVRLRDVPREERLLHLNDALRHAKTPQEAERLFLLALDPGDAGGRIAA